MSAGFGGDLEHAIDGGNPVTEGGLTGNLLLKIGEHAPQPAFSIRAPAHPFEIEEVAFGCVVADTG
jgi:hypothetical protein